MFDPEFYPTPPEVIDMMLEGQALKGKTVLEPSAGKGDIVDYLLNHQVSAVLAVEKHPDLRAIVERKCCVIGSDFMDITSDQISQVDLIVMNPPFSKSTYHIHHAFDIAPPGCRIISLCNYNAFQHDKSLSKASLRTLVDNHGSVQDIGQSFKYAERDTHACIGLVSLLKPGGGYEHEFEGFFMEEDSEEQAVALMPYNLIRDMVNRYVEAIKIFDRQLDSARSMHQILDGFFSSDLAMSISERNHQEKRSAFKKDLQKSAWATIFDRLDLLKYSTKGLKEDINKFVETQTQVPFTMRNVYKMLEIVVATTTQRMDKALLEVFDRITAHHHENRHFKEGWQTNSHFLVNRKFILPSMCCFDPRYHSGNAIQYDFRGNWEFVEDLIKALCYISGDKYELFGRLFDWVTYRYKILTDDGVTFYHSVEDYNGYAEKAKALTEAHISYRLIDYNPVYSEWFEWAYFRVKAFKKGSMHFEFLDAELWGRFNQRIARLKGYPLYEPKQQTAWQKHRDHKAV